MSLERCGTDRSDAGEPHPDQPADRGDVSRREVMPSVRDGEGYLAVTEAAPPGIQHVKIRANGIDFNVATLGKGERLALLLHGFPESSFSWRYQMPLLAGMGYRAWAPDLRGYGGSTRPLGVGAYALSHLEEDVAALIEAAGATEVVLIGHDWGALIAWYYAMFGRVPIARLVIMNVPHPALAEKGLRTFKQLKKSWYIFFFQIPWLPEWGLARNDALAIGRGF